MVLHSELTIVEHHHHGELDLFPDFNCQIPFGPGTSIIYNNLDYRVRTDTEQSFQFLVSTTDEHLRGEIRAEHVPAVKFHIREEDAYFYESGGDVYRHLRIVRLTRDKHTGLVTSEEQVLENHALVTYDRELITAPIRPDSNYTVPATPVATETT